MPRVDKNILHHNHNERIPPIDSVGIDLILGGISEKFNSIL